jgi:hypothetical protein
VFGSAFSQSWFVSIGPVGNSMIGDRIEQVLVEAHAEGRVVFALESNRWLVGFERLHRSLEADRSRFDAMFDGRLCRDCSDQIVGQDVRPKLLPDQLLSLAS